jgi:hypothetical protein
MCFSPPSRLFSSFRDARPARPRCPTPRPPRTTPDPACRGARRPPMHTLRASIGDLVDNNRRVAHFSSLSPLPLISSFLEAVSLAHTPASSPSPRCVRVRLLPRHPFHRARSSAHDPEHARPRMPFKRHHSHVTCFRTYCTHKFVVDQVAWVCNGHCAIVLLVFPLLGGCLAGVHKFTCQPSTPAFHPVYISSDRIR